LKTVEEVQDYNIVTLAKGLSNPEKGKRGNLDKVTVFK